MQRQNFWIRILQKTPTSVLLIMLGITIASLGILPRLTVAYEGYNMVFNAVAPLTVFFAMLNIDLHNIRLINTRFLFYGAVGIVGTLLGAIIGIYFLNQNTIFDSQNQNIIGAMFVGTYVGGTANLNAIAVHFGIQNQWTFFILINLVDNIVTALYLGFSILAPRFLHKIYPIQKKLSIEFIEEKNILQHKPLFMTTLNIIFLLFLGYAVSFVSYKINQFFTIVSPIIFQTIFALLFGRLPFIKKMNEKSVLEKWYYFLFLFMIGLLSDVSILFQQTHIALFLFCFAMIIVVTHSIFIFFIGFLFKEDWDIISVISQANIGGTASTLICAKNLERNDLFFIAVLFSTLGNAIGTFVGIVMYEVFSKSF